MSLGKESARIVQELRGSFIKKKKKAKPKFLSSEMLTLMRQWGKVLKQQNRTSLRFYITDFFLSPVFCAFQMAYEFC